MHVTKPAIAIDKDASIPDTFPGCFGFWDYFKDECWGCAYNVMCKQQMNMAVI